MTRILTLVLALAATPALAAEENFFSLRSTEFVVWIAFLVFLAVLVFFKVPGMIGAMLDKRADTIRAELDEARKLREEAQELRASFERKKAEVRQRVLNEELNHRVKNILALIKSLVNQPAGEGKSLEEFASALRGRIMALSFA